MTNPLNETLLVKSRSLTSGETFRRILPVAQDDREEVEPDAELLVLDGDGGRPAAAGLRDRDGELAAGEEAGLLPAAWR